MDNTTAATIKTRPQPDPIEDLHSPVPFCIIDGTEVDQLIISDPLVTNLYFFGDDHDCDALEMVDIKISHRNKHNEFNISIDAASPEAAAKLLKQAATVVVMLPAVGVPYVETVETPDHQNGKEAA
ncbi:MAG: hypothetical protein V4662_25085 [Verrucomicrobiota bacterium]